MSPAVQRLVVKCPVCGRVFATSVSGMHVVEHHANEGVTCSGVGRIVMATIGQPVRG